MGSTEVQCRNSECLNQTMARYSCDLGYAFKSQFSLRGGYQALTCTNTTWAGAIDPCVVSEMPRMDDLTLFTTLSPNPHPKAVY